MVRDSVVVAAAGAALGAVLVLGVSLLNGFQTSFVHDVEMAVRVCFVHQHGSGVQVTRVRVSQLHAQ